MVNESNQILSKSKIWKCKYSTDKIPKIDIVNDKEINEFCQNIYSTESFQSDSFVTVNEDIIMDNNILIEVNFKKYNTKLNLIWNLYKIEFN